MSKSFKKQTELNPENILIVDSLNLGFRWKHSGQLNFVNDYMNTVDSLRKSYACGKVIITSDWGSSAYRKALYPEYKQNRKDKQELQTPEEEKEFELFFEEYLKVLETYRESTHYPVLRYKNVEADDIASYIVKYRNRFKVSKIVLVSSDRDWDLLINDDVMRFSYITRKETRVDNWDEHYDCALEEYISIKCLQGDQGDNIPGVDQVGPARAASLVKQYGSTYDIIASMPLPGKYKYIGNLNKFGTQALMLNYQLMDLLEFCDEAIGPDNCRDINSILEVYLNGTTN